MKHKKKLIAAAVITTLAVAVPLFFSVTWVPATSAPAEQPLSVRVGTINALGASHTDKPSGKYYGKRLKSKARTKLLVQVIDARKLDAIALQEFQYPQQVVFRKIAGDRYGLYCPTNKGKPTDNCVAWNRKTTKWVDSEGTFDVPYFKGKKKPMPILSLIDRSSGKYFAVTSVHNPCSCEGSGPGMAKARVQGWKLERQVQRFFSGFLNTPTFLMGDRNALYSVYRKHAVGTFSQKKGIDFIVRDDLSRFTFTNRVRTPKIRQATDHPLVYAGAR